MPNLTTMPNFKPSDDIEVTITATGELLVDSRLVAARLGRDHNDWFTSSIMKYKKECEAEFGSLRVETVTIKRQIGATQSKFVWLTEDQCIFFVMNSRNNGNVLACKIAIIKRFSEARKRIAELEQAQLNQANQAQLNEVANPKLILNPETLEPEYNHNQGTKHDHNIESNLESNLESQIVNKIAMKASKATKLNDLVNLFALADNFRDLLAEL